MNPSILAVCLDSGDNLVDESTEIKDENEVTLRAELRACFLSSET